MRAGGGYTVGNMETSLLRTLIVAVAGLVIAAPLARGEDKPPEKPATKPAEKYQIQFHRPSKVGDRFHIEAVGATRKRTLVSIDGKEGDPIDELVGVSVEGVVTVTEVAPSGVETKLTLTIENCVASVGKKQLPLLPAGTVIGAAWDKGKKGTAFTLDGQAIPADIAELLELAVNTSDPESQLDDEIFGSKDKHQVGDSWPINAAAASKEFTRMGIKTKEEDLYGESTVVAQTDVAGTPSLQMKTEFKARSLASDDKAEGKIKLVSGNMVITTGVTLPVDPALPPSKAEMKMKLIRELAGKTDEGKELHAVETVEREWERIIKTAAKK
jgi:hypothetical protein